MKNKPIFKGLKKRKRKNLAEIIAEMPVEIISKDGKTPDVLVQKIKYMHGLCYSISPLGLDEYTVKRIKKDGIFYFFYETKKTVTYDAEPYGGATKCYFFKIE